MKTAYNFGAILQKLRKEHKMTQEQLARKINKESSIISRYEKNLQSPTFETVRSFAAIFNVSMDYLSGMEKNSQISTYGMTDEQIKMVKGLVQMLCSKNSIKPQISNDECLKLIGSIVKELV
ncbi:helix-turn-helix transcriptional regulator [Ruminococcus sp. NK3A76]|uniref:helix-turn-helix domain-containing protein n=1 Tax=Ruminococcus sp. NK3A76 TaxID=877411 RepID=UPI00068EC8B2|nr:helix-turn-helix transcriptional regulator [Ruminococcus sp. NK3A76]